jgi:hypothetical protein
MKVSEVQSHEGKKVRDDEEFCSSLISRTLTRLFILGIGDV